MARTRLVGLLAYGLAPLSCEAVGCSAGCQDEVKNACVPFKVRNTGASHSEALAQCQREIDSGRVPMLVDAGCPSSGGCALPTDLLADSTPPGEGDNPQAQEPSEKPSEPTLCTPTNRGRCTCLSSSQGEHIAETYTWWVLGAQRCVSYYRPGDLPQNTKAPVLLFNDCYVRDQWAINFVSEKGIAARRFGYSLILLSTPHGAWRTGDDGVANKDNPMPCGEGRSEDWTYVRDVLHYLIFFSRTLSAGFDLDRVYAAGFSQNGMFPAYMQYCFPHRIKGIFQGGAGLALARTDPIPPGLEGSCKKSDAEALSRDCLQQRPCTECEVWPLYPCFARTLKPSITCSMSYTNDGVVYRSATANHPHFMYERAQAEGHDARRLIFSPTAGVEGRHSPPGNWDDWIVGCLGMTPQCSQSCESALITCMGSSGPSVDRYSECVESTANAGNCVAGCAPTLTMLKQSEDVDAALALGVFGDSAAHTMSMPRTQPKSSRCVLEDYLSYIGQETEDGSGSTGVGGTSGETEGSSSRGNASANLSNGSTGGGGTTGGTGGSSPLGSASMSLSNGTAGGGGGSSLASSSVSSHGALALIAWTVAAGTGVLLALCS